MGAIVVAASKQRHRTIGAAICCSANVGRGRLFEDGPTRLIHSRAGRWRAMRVLVALCLLLCLVTAAHAECAWVLWAQATSQGGLIAAPVAGWTRWEDCDKDRISRQAKMAPKENMPSGTAVSFVCLPDTVDARGPKEK